MSELRERHREALAEALFQSQAERLHDGGLGSHEADAGAILATPAYAALLDDQLPHRPNSLFKDHLFTEDTDGVHFHTWFGEQTASIGHRHQYAGPHIHAVTVDGTAFRVAADEPVDATIRWKP